MSKMRYFSRKFSKIAKRCELFAPSAPLPFDIGDLKCVILQNYGVSNWLWRIRTFEKSVKMSFQWRHYNYVTEKCHQNNVTKIFQLGPSQSKFMATPVDKSNCSFILSVKSNYKYNWKNL